MPDIEEEDETYRRILETAEQKEIPVLRFHEGLEMKSARCSLECLAPEKDADSSDRNESSLVLAVQYGSFRALLTGDIEGEAEKHLIESGRTGKLSVLKVAHHGSKYSTPEEFLDIAEPAAAIISCGRDNSYGHPAPELLERLENAGAVIYTTMEQGAVTVKTDGGQFSALVQKK